MATPLPGEWPSRPPQRWHHAFLELLMLTSGRQRRMGEQEGADQAIGLVKT